MSNLTEAGRRVQAEALAKALAGGRYTTFDGDGAPLASAAFPHSWEVHGDGCGFTFKSLDPGRVSRRGIQRRFEASGPGGEVLLSGTVGGPMNKGVDVSADDPQVYEGMDFEVEEFTHRLRFPQA